MLARMTVAEYDPAKYPGEIYFGPHRIQKIEPRPPANERPAFRLTKPNGDTFSVYATETIRVFVPDTLGSASYLNQEEVTDVEVRPQGSQADLQPGG